jgi:hypothetical protein
MGIATGSVSHPDSVRRLRYVDKFAAAGCPPKDPNELNEAAEPSAETGVPLPWAR